MSGRKQRPNTKQEEPPTTEEYQKALRLLQQMNTRLEAVVANFKAVESKLQEAESKLQETQSENERLSKECASDYEAYQDEIQKEKDQYHKEQLFRIKLQKELSLIKEKDKISYRQANDVFESVLEETNAWLTKMSLTRDGDRNWWDYKFRGFIEKTDYNPLWYRLRLVRRERHVLSDEQKQKMRDSSSSYNDSRPAEIVVIESQIKMTLEDAYIASIQVFDIPRLGIFRDMDKMAKKQSDNPLNLSVMEGKKFANLITHVSFMLSFKFLEFIREHYWVWKSGHELAEFDTTANVSIFPAAEGTEHIMERYYSEFSTTPNSTAYKVFDKSGNVLTEEYIQTLIDDWQEATRLHERDKTVKANPSAKSRFNACL